MENTITNTALENMGFKRHSEKGLVLRIYEGYVEIARRYPENSRLLTLDISDQRMPLPNITSVSKLHELINLLKD